MADETALPINSMSSTTVSDLVDHFRLETRLHPDFTLEVVRAVQPRGRRIVRTEKRWTKESELGYGTFGEVWLEKNQNGEARAVKGVKKRKNTGIDYYKELLAMAKLSKHLQLFVEFFGWYETKDSLFIAMEYLKHGDLHKYVIRTGTCSENDAKAIAYQLLEGLGVMHEMGFAHRDLKPQNIFVSQPSPDWWIKIGDFGIAKRVQITDETAFRTEIGTRIYRAPEVDCLLDEDSEEYTNSVDIWSLGCVVFWILTKEVPFASTNKVFDFVHKKIPFPSTPLENKGVSEECLGFLQRAIAIQPSDRPTAQDALESQWLKDIDAGPMDEESPAVIGTPSEASEHPQIGPSRTPELLDQSIVLQQAEQNEAQGVDLHSDYEFQTASEDETSSEDQTALPIQVVLPVEEISTTTNEQSIQDSQPAQENEPVQDRWAQIREIAAEKAATSARLAVENDEGYTSGEETIETRVARIKVRVAELTGNVDYVQGVAPSTPSQNSGPHALQRPDPVSKDSSESQTKDDVASKETIGGRPSVNPQISRLNISDTSSLVIPSRRKSWLGGLKNAATYDLLQSIKDKNDRNFLRALKGGGDPDVTLKVGIEKLAIIHLVANYGSVTMFNALLKRGVNPNARPAKPPHGKTALHFAVIRGSRPMVERLVQAHALIEAINEHGQTPLALAAQFHLVDIARLLLKHGANVEGATTTSFSPLHEAIYNNEGSSGTRLRMVKLLIEWRPNVNAKAGFGETPLHSAILRKLLTEAKLLLAAGANINEVDIHGKTALYYTIGGRSLSLFQLLTKNGADVPSMKSLTHQQQKKLKWLLNATEQAQEKEAKAPSSRASREI